MSDQMNRWPKGESPTGRGYTQGSDSYRADDVAWEEVEMAALQERRRRAAILNHGYQRPPCTCRDSESGMDVDRCPVHGIGCT
jgi:hypothetical protein